MPIVIIEMWEGRTEEQKRQLVHVLTQGCVDTLHCPESAVQVILHEVSRSNWGIAGELQNKH